MKLTEKQKLEILCAYLPYGVECITTEDPYPTLLDGVQGNGYCYLGGLDAHLKDFSPILRHRDDMTDEELEELAGLIGYDNTKYAKWWLMGDPYDVTIQQAKQALNYLHSIHIDTFGAIEAGWAIRKPTEK